MLCSSVNRSAPTPSSATTPPPSSTPPPAATPAPSTTSPSRPCRHLRHTQVHRRRASRPRRHRRDHRHITPAPCPRPQASTPPSPAAHHNGGAFQRPHIGTANAAFMGILSVGQHRGLRFPFKAARSSFPQLGPTARRIPPRYILRLAHRLERNPARIAELTRLAPAGIRARAQSMLTMTPE
jgi:hypothetical protein